jgi:hypothetical protein
MSLRCSTSRAAGQEWRGIRVSNDKAGDHTLAGREHRHRGSAWRSAVPPRSRRPSRLSRLATVSDGFSIVGMTAVLACVWPVVDMGIAFGRPQAVRRRLARSAPRCVPTTAERSSSPGGCLDGGQRDRHPPFPRQGTSGTPWRSRRLRPRCRIDSKISTDKVAKLTTIPTALAAPKSSAADKGQRQGERAKPAARRAGSPWVLALRRWRHTCDSNRNASTGRKCYAAAREGNRIWKRNQQKTVVIGIV